MADNVKVLPSTNAAAVNVATDQIGSVHYPVYKTAYGADGSVTQVDADNPLPVANTPDLIFSTTGNLANGETYDSGVLSLENYSQVQTDIMSDVDGTITINFCADNASPVNIVRTLTIPYTGTNNGGAYQMFSAPAFTPFVQYKFTAGEAGQAAFWYATKATNSAISPQILGTDAFISPLMVAQLNRSVIVGKTAGGTYSNVGITNQSSLQVTPPQEGKTSFGEALTGQLVDQVLLNFAFENIEGLVQTKANQSGTVTNASQLCTVSTGGAVDSSGQAESIERVRYVPGHGNRARFTAGFTTGVADSTQLAGIGDESDGFFFGYNGTSFGILHRYGGSPKIIIMGISAGASSSGNITITLDGDAELVALTDTSSSIENTVATIAAHDYSDVGRGWSAYANSNTVIFVSWDAAVHGGTYSFADTGSTGATSSGFVSIITGVAPTEDWIPQASWNGADILDGNGLTGSTLDPTKLNVYQIQYQYLGAGNIFFFVEDSNDGEFHLVHTIRYANTETTTSIGNPHLPLMLIAENGATSSSTLTVNSASMAGMTDGFIELVGNRRAVSANSGSISAATPVITIRNMVYYPRNPPKTQKKNTNKIKILSISTTSTIASGNGTVRLDLIKNCTLKGTHTWGEVEANVSIAETCSNATTYDNTSGRIIASEQSIVNTVTRFDSLDANDLVLEAGETLTVIATPSGNNTTVYVSIRFVELF